MSQTKAQLIDTLVASLLPASDSSVDIGSNAVRFANIYGDTLYGNGANLTGINTDLVSDTSPQLGGNLDVNTKNILFGDSGGASDDRLIFGAGSDFEIYHNGFTSIIGSASHTLGFYSDVNHHFLNANGSETSAKFTINGSAELYYDNSKKFETTSAGVSVTGTITSTDSANVADGHVLCQLDSGNGRLKLLSGSDAITVDIQGSVGNVKIVDNGKFQAGDSNDLQIYHDGSHSNIINSTGVLKVRGVAGQSITFRNGDDSANVAVFNVDDATHLYFDSSHKFSTNSTGIRVIGNCIPGSNDSGQLGTSSIRWQELNITDVIDVSDNGKIRMGDGDDLQIYHNGTDSVINNDTGDLYVQSDDQLILKSVGTTEIRKHSGDELMIKAVPDGAVELYHDNSKKLNTISTGALVTGGLGVGLSPTFDSAHSSTYAIQASAASQCLIAAFRTQDGVSASTNGMIMGLDGNYHYLIGRESRPMHIGTNGSTQIEITTNGDFKPLSNNARDLGSTSLRWRNVYTNDLNLSNEGGANDVDGTWGSYTIQEGAEDLFLVNKRSGKKYKFNLTEVS